MNRSDVRTKSDAGTRVAALLCAAALGACASPAMEGAAPAASAAPAAPLQMAAVPAVLQPGPGERRAFSFSARGVQIYECKAAGSGAPAWTFVAPEAELFDDAGAPAGRHGAGPFWQHHDGSKVIGTAKQRADAPEPGAVPWLLLEAKSAGGPGVLAAVTSIQRTNTHGGAAPAQGCASGDVGRQLRIPYTADYVFFVAR